GACCCRNVERDTGHDEVSTETVDRQGHQPAKERPHNKSCEQADGRASRRRTCENCNQCCYQHHAFHADIEYACAVRDHHAQCRQQKRRGDTQDCCDEGRIENLCKNGAHDCSPSRLRKFRIRRSTVG